VDNFWLKDQNLQGVGARFFRFDPLKRNGRDRAGDDDVWLLFRDRWEYSHVLRAIFSAVSLTALVAAVAVR
jgi:hypothetical protein